MTTFVNFFRTTGIRLALIYLSVFTVALGLSVFYMISSVENDLQAGVVATLDAEVASLSAIYRRGGIGAMTRAIERRARAPGASLYLVTNLDGERLAGNIAALSGNFRVPEAGVLTQITYRRGENDARREAFIRAFRLVGGFGVIVGRDLAEQHYFRAVLSQVLQFWLLVVVALSIVTWVFVNRRVVKRIDALSAAGQRIMDGNLSDRLPVTGSGDEFDRLAAALNAMLARIESLMHGFREVSDNVAHDLKTPLTRMRNRLELALQSIGRSEGASTGADNGSEVAPSSARDLPTSQNAPRAVLASAIEECDNLIRTFDALLKIARLEAETAGGGMHRCNLREIAAEMVEFYTPLAEESGAQICLLDGDDTAIYANRQLVAQALANLIENALKYGRSPADGSLTVTVSVGRNAGGARFCVKDHGPGIAAEERERSVKRFVRLNPARNTPGSGLGLSLVHAVAGMHNGRLQLEDNAPGLAASVILMKS